jgi:GTP-binding protein
MPDIQTQDEGQIALPHDSHVSLPIVAIVGRPNVGKSSLFNRILGRRHAIVSEVSGTTRDRLISQVEWLDRSFILIDTGGLETKPEGPIRERVQEQADMAVAGADVIIFLTDVTEGLTVDDLAAVERLRRTTKPVILAVNKVDNETREFSASEFYQLGLKEPMLISAYHNIGVYPLMDQVFALLPTPPEFDEDWEPDESAPTDLKIAIIGRTNVGKSMLMNSILGQERSIVTPEAGTTRDALDTYMNYDGHDITLIDTAGMRRRGLVQRGIEKFSVIRAVNAVGRSEITLLVIDATELATAQDSHIAGLAWEMCRGLIVVVNKWDLAEDGSRYAQQRTDDLIRDKLQFMSYVPIVFTSALHGRGIDPLLRTVLELQQERSRFVPSRELQYVMAKALASHAPPPVKGHSRERVYFSRLRQVGINPPTFLFTVDKPWLVHFSYERYMENQIRSNFGFDHTHLKLVFKRS